MTPAEYLELSKQIQNTLATNDQVIDTKRCYIFDLIIASDGGGDSDAQLYNGQNSSGEKVVALYCVDESTYQYHFDPPLCLEKGAFIDIGTNCESVLVRHMS